MADPVNPNNPGGPATPPPVDPGTGAQFSGMEDALRDAQEFASSSKKVADEAARTTNEFYKGVKHVEKTVDAYKELTRLAKKYGDTMSREWKDAKNAKKDLEKLVSLHEQALKTQQAGTREYTKASKNLAQLRKELEIMSKSGGVMEQQFDRLKELMADIATNARSVAKAIGDMGRAGASIRGLAGIFEAMGMGKPATRIDRRLSQIEDVKEAIAQSKQLRGAATMKHMKEKRGKALEEIGAMHKKGGLWRDDETGDVMDLMDKGGNLTRGGRNILAQKMGFKKGTDKYDKFMMGEAAGGEAAIGAEGAAGAAGAGWASAMSEGGGAIEGLASGMEGLTSVLFDFAPEIAILIEAIKLLAELFGAYTKQNKEMEKALGKGGLFTQAGIGPGEAFGKARGALTPGGGKFGLGTVLGAGLGINWERNLAIAGQLTEGGMAAFPGMMGADVANQRPGAAGEFMQGGVGEIQRIVMGAGRIGGLTDQEGVGQVIKLLGEYRETIASSEDFMVKLNKDTAAAGISTTKYLKIIDEVSSAFDKMSKSLDQVTGVMRELSRYGSISSESLKDMMDFLSKGQAKTDTGNMATAAFTQSIMPKDILEGVRAAQQSTLSNYVDEYNAEASQHGMSKLNVDDIQAKIKAGKFADAQGMADSMMTEIDKVTDPTVKQPMLDALTKVQDQINRVSGVMSPDFLKRASAQGLYGMNEADKLGALLANIRGSTAFSGLSVTDLLSGKGTAEQQIMLQQLTQQLGITGSPAQINQALRRIGANRVSDIGNENVKKGDRIDDAKSMMNELYKGSKQKGGWRVFLESKGPLAKQLSQTAKSQDEAVEAMMQTPEGIKELQAIFGQGMEYIAGSSETSVKLLKATQEGHKTDEQGIRQTITNARSLALRTQTVEEILSNTFKPLLIKLVSKIEGIAATVFKWFMSDSGDSTTGPAAEGQGAKDMASVKDTIDSLNKDLDKNATDLANFNEQHLKNGKFDTKANKEMAQHMMMSQSLGADALNKLEEISQSSTFKDDQQRKDALAYAEQVKKGQFGGGMGDAGKGVTINQFYSSNATMDTQQPAGAAVSPEKAKDMARQGQ